jgi:hypothetical protein
MWPLLLQGSGGESIENRLAWNRIKRSQDFQTLMMASPLTAREKVTHVMHCIFPFVLAGAARYEANTVPYGPLMDAKSETYSELSDVAPSIP